MPYGFIYQKTSFIQRGYIIQRDTSREILNFRMALKCNGNVAKGLAM